MDSIRTANNIALLGRQLPDHPAVGTKTTSGSITEIVAEAPATAVPGAMDWQATDHRQ
jgi:hypothetical protein